MPNSEKHHILPAPKFTNPTRILIVISPYYTEITDGLLGGATAAIQASGATYDVAEVPDVFEIPTAIKLATAARFYDGFVALGCVINDEISEYNVQCNETTRGLMLLGLDGVCVGNGILAVEKHKRAKTMANNIGSVAAMGAMHLIRLKRRFTKTGAGRISPPSEHILMAGEAKGNQGTA